MIIAIDGPAGSGKSTVAKKVALRLGFHYLDTGAMYRCVTLAALDAGVDFDDASSLTQIARDIDISFGRRAQDSLSTTVILDGTDVTDLIRTSKVDAYVSTVAAVAGVREALVDQQRSIASTSDAVMEGRDIATVVAPDAEVKIFLTADPEERAARRAAQNVERGFGQTDPQKILEEIAERDRIDSTRKVAPLKAADDAVELDSTALSIEEVCDAIEALVQRQRGA